MDKFRNKYRIPSARRQQWDYRRAAAYFITICTANRVHYFGEIADGKMQLSETGNIVQNEWLKTFELRTDMNLFMGEFVVMPNHFHAIVGIGENDYNTQCGAPRGTQCGAQCRDAMHCVSTDTDTDTDTADKCKNQFGPQSKNLASIVRGFKSSVTVAARKINPAFQWQSRFHDHIIRNGQSFQKISNYIINNPAQWQDDKFFNAG